MLKWRRKNGNEKLERMRGNPLPPALVPNSSVMSVWTLVSDWVEKILCIIVQLVGRILQYLVCVLIRRLQKSSLVHIFLLPLQGFTRKYRWTNMGEQTSLCVGFVLGSIFAAFSSSVYVNANSKQRLVIEPKFVLERTKRTAVLLPTDLVE